MILLYSPLTRPLPGTTRETNQYFQVPFPISEGEFVPTDSPTDIATDVNAGNPVIGRHRAPGRRHPVRLYAAAAIATGDLSPQQR